MKTGRGNGREFNGEGENYPPLPVQPPFRFSSRTTSRKTHVGQRKKPLREIYVKFILPTLVIKKKKIITHKIRFQSSVRGGGTVK